jgi:hypothetical protein
MIGDGKCRLNAGWIVMLIKEILVPHAVAEICYLSEALMWVGFNRFPLGTPVEASWDDLRRDMDYIVGLDPNVEVEDPTDAGCHLAIRRQDLPEKR